MQTDFKRFSWNLYYRPKIIFTDHCVTTAKMPASSKGRETKKIYEGTVEAHGQMTKTSRFQYSKTTSHKMNFSLTLFNALTGDFWWSCLYKTDTSIRQILSLIPIGARLKRFYCIRKYSSHKLWCRLLSFCRISDGNKNGRFRH